MGKNIAFIRCSGDDDKAKKKYEYDGVMTCEAANMFASGPKTCFYSCIGYGDCVTACNFEAIEISEKGLPVVFDDACTGCGACAEACPKDIIEMLPKDSKVYVGCVSKDMGKSVKEGCSIGCIACRLCEKNCPHDAVHVVDNIAYVDQEKCVSCGICVVKCPTKVIADKIPHRPKMTITDKCIGCGKCKTVCPVNCITGEAKQKHEIDPEKCIGCAECALVCPVNKSPKLPGDAIIPIGGYNLD